MDEIVYYFIIIAAIGSGMVAGVLFAFSAFVMKALNRLSAEQSIAAMQSINITVLNPLFSVLFFGTGLISLFILITSFNRWNEPDAIYLLVGSASYLIALFITGAFNVPLNNKLAVVNPAANDGTQKWGSFVAKWMIWNHIRTLACVASSAFLIIAFHLQ